MRVCEACSERVQSRQIAEYQSASRQSDLDEVYQMWLSLEQVNEKLRKLQSKIDENLPKVWAYDIAYIKFLHFKNICIIWKVLSKNRYL